MFKKEPDEKTKLLKIDTMRKTLFGNQYQR